MPWRIVVSNWCSNFERICYIGAITIWVVGILYVATTDYGSHHHRRLHLSYACRSNPMCIWAATHPQK